MVIKKFFCVATVEERLLAVRKRRNSGLLADAEAPQLEEEGPEADAMAVPVVGDSGEGGDDGGAAMAVRIGDLRFVLGFAD